MTNLQTSGNDRGERWTYLSNIPIDLLEVIDGVIYVYLDGVGYEPLEGATAIAKHHARGWVPLEPGWRVVELPHPAIDFQITYTPSKNQNCRQ
jgi:hypothetical protein